MESYILLNSHCWHLRNQLVCLMGKPPAYFTYCVAAIPVCHCALLQLNSYRNVYGIRTGTSWRKGWGHLLVNYHKICVQQHTHYRLV